MLKTLLTSGYFPRELPPLFTTKSLADALVNHPAPLPTPFTKAKADWTSATYHNLARIGGLRRRLGVPNPVNYFRLAKTFEIHQSALYQKWALSPYSRTSPTTPKDRSGFAPENIDRATARAAARVGSRYLLRTDIAQFYPSIYTHSVAWVAHTKAVAKNQIGDMSLFGNVIDKELQACQHGQTKGVPIGPATSLGIAELILSDIDVHLHNKCQIHSGVRFIDDFELSFQTLASAEDALVRIEGLLYEYELQLNAGKTTICDLPQTIEAAYVTRLRPHIPPSKSASRSQWIDFFNLAFELSRQYSAEGVLRYAVGCIQRIGVSAKQWSLFQQLLWQSIATDAGCLRFVIDALWRRTRQATGHKLDVPLAQDALDSLITRSAPIGHASEVVWSIWAAMLFNLSLSDNSRLAISKMEDSFVACAAQLAVDKGVFPNVDTQQWAAWMLPGCFRESNWLFAYEAYRRGWLAAECKTAKIGSDATCKFLKRLGVSFLDDNAPAAYVPPKRLVLSGIGGETY